jgi:hypothetical protein
MARTSIPQDIAKSGLESSYEDCESFRGIEVCLRSEITKLTTTLALIDDLRRTASAAEQLGTSCPYWNPTKLAVH